MCIDPFKIVFVINAALSICILKQSLFDLHVLPYAGLIGSIIHLLIASLIHRITRDDFAICVLRVFGPEKNEVSPKPDTRRHPRYVIATLMIMSEFNVLTSFMNIYLFIKDSRIEVNRTFLDWNLGNKSME